MAYILSSEGKNIEVYASMSDEYGFFYKFARNKKNDHYEYCFEYDFNPEDDEEDEDEGVNPYTSKEMKKWHNLIPDVIRNEFGISDTWVY